VVLGSASLLSILRDARMPTATVSNDDRLGRLERLAALHASGVLSDDEFAAEKQRLLDEQ
jgi:hypothetical protein